MNHEEIIQNLVAAGEWHIDEEAFKLFQTAKDPEDVDFICSVYYGNHVFDFVGRGNDLDEGDEHFYLDYEQYVPIELVDDSLHTHTDGQLDKKEFRFEITPGELDLAFYNKQSDIGTFARTDENKVSIEAFKRSVVEKLLDDKMIAMKPDEYKFMHDNGICYHQQFYKQRNEYLSKLAHPDKLPTDELVIHESARLIDNIKVELEYIGEGRYGDYNEKDPEDTPFLRFYVSRLEDGNNWVELDDCSYCTQIPATAPQNIVDAAAEHICKEYVNAIKASDLDVPPKNLGEQLSWLSDKDFEVKDKSNDTELSISEKDIDKLAKADKLSPDTLINLSRFYFDSNYSAKNMSGSIEKIVDKMDEAGFAETKKNIMFDSMAKLIDDSVNREVFRKTIKMYSGLKKKAESKTAAHTKERV